MGRKAEKLVWSLGTRLVERKAGLEPGNKTSGNEKLVWSLGTRLVGRKAGLEPGNKTSGTKSWFGAWEQD